MEQNWEPRNKPRHLTYGQLIFDKEARIHNEKKDSLFASRAGKVEQPYIRR